MITNPNINKQAVIKPIVETNSNNLSELDVNVLNFFSKESNDLRTNYRVRSGVDCQVYHVTFGEQDYALKIRANSYSTKNKVKSIVSPFMTNLIWGTHIEYLSCINPEKKFEQEKKIRRLWAENNIRTPKEYKTDIQNIQILEWIDSVKIDTLFKRSNPTNSNGEDFSIMNIVTKQEITENEKLRVLEHIAHDLYKRHTLAIEKNNVLLVPTDSNPSNVIQPKYELEPVWLDSDLCINIDKSDVKTVSARSLGHFISSILTYLWDGDVTKSEKIVESICSGYSDKEILNKIVSISSKSSNYIKMKQFMRNAINIISYEEKQIVLRVPEMIQSNL